MCQVRRMVTIEIEINWNRVALHVALHPAGITSPSRQWSDYGGARGGLANLKDLAAPAKHLF